MKKSIKKLPKRYKEQTLDQHVMRAKALYSKGEIMEAFLILYGAIEYLLLDIWVDYVRFMTATREYHYQREVWQYDELVRLLYDLKLINASERSILLDFKKGRNEVAHKLGKPFNDEISIQNLNHRFKNGLKSSNFLLKIASYLDEELSIGILKIRLAENEITQEEFHNFKKNYEDTHSYKSYRQL